LLIHKSWGIDVLKVLKQFISCIFCQQLHFYYCETTTLHNFHNFNNCCKNLYSLSLFYKTIETIKILCKGGRVGSHVCNSSEGTMVKILAWRILIIVDRDLWGHSPIFIDIIHNLVWISRGFPCFCIEDH
jgi:hypothetical protein